MTKNKLFVHFIKKILHSIILLTEYLAYSLKQNVGFAKLSFQSILLLKINRYLGNKYFDVP